MTKKLNIPMWGYALIVLLSPLCLFGLIMMIGYTLDILFELLGQFPYWWAVFAVVGYLLLGTVFAGVVSSFEKNIHE